MATGASTVIADYTYDVVNRYNTVAYLNGLTNRVDYDALGRTTRASVTPTGGGTALADYRYGYDAVGNRTYMQRYHQTGQPADVYAYDGQYQLTQVWYGADATDPLSITSYTSLHSYDLDLLVNPVGAGRTAVTSPSPPAPGLNHTEGAQPARSNRPPPLRRRLVRAHRS